MPARDFQLDSPGGDDSPGCVGLRHSDDGGETWSKPRPTPFTGPCSPLCMRRIPQTGDLLAVWNDHSGSFPMTEEAKRNADHSPLVAAITTDNGKT